MREGDGPGRKLRRPRAQNAERSQATRTRGTGASRRRGASRRPNTVAEQAGAEELPPWPGGAFTLRATGIPGLAPPGADEAARGGSASSAQPASSSFLHSC